MHRGFRDDGEVTLAERQSAIRPIAARFRYLPGRRRPRRGHLQRLAKGRSPCYIGGDEFLLQSMKATPDENPPHAAAHMRVSYEMAELREEDLAPDPVDQFAVWFQETVSAKLPEPNAMTLATVDGSGRPAQRAVLLKHWDKSGFVFFTNKESRKATHMAANPEVSLHFLWLDLQRQVSISGRVEPVSLAQTAAYFALRPFGSQIGAWLSPQSQVVSSKAMLLAKLDEIKRKFADGKVPVPSFWGGYRVVPREFEFWQGGRDRLHDRFRYSKNPDGIWLHERLAP